MPSAEYFRRQADICLRLSLIASDDEVSSRLITMAREYMAKGDTLAKEGAMDMRIGRAAMTEGVPDGPGGAQASAGSGDC
jgi:hypothetical protein